MDSSPLLALQSLRRTSHKHLAKAAVEELVRRDVLRLQRYTPTRGRRRTPKYGLTEGSAPLPSGALLLLVARTVQRTPIVVVDAHAFHDLDVATHALARLSSRLADAALQDLGAAGLVEQQATRILGAWTRRRWRRTAAGDDMLRRSGSGDGGGSVVTSGVVIVGDPKPSERRGDTDGDGSLDAAFDGSFDASFDTAFSDGGDGGGGDTGD